MKDNMHNNDTPAELVLKIVSSRKGDQKTNKQNINVVAEFLIDSLSPSFSQTISSIYI